MKKTLLIIGKVVLGLLILFAIFLILMMIYNQIMLKKNKDLYETPLGQLLEVDGHNISYRYQKSEQNFACDFQYFLMLLSPYLSSDSIKALICTLISSGLLFCTS